MASGTVYLVGAGPGDPELLTLKAARLLATADAVVYDRLVPEAVLARAPAAAERIFVGKSCGRHLLPQAEINALLVRLAREGRTVVRLKGGDPFVFGRGGEEAEHLASQGVPYEVVPGVSAAMAAPAAAGIPVTHRELASSLAIVTGHASSDGREPPWAALARLDTLVFLMGVTNLPHIAGELLAAGRAGSTPAALVEAAYWPHERTIVGTLETIVAEAGRAGVEAPATLVVGEVVRLRARLRPAARPDVS